MEALSGLELLALGLLIGILLGMLFVLILTVTRR